MNTIKYATGRTYDAPQVLEITFLNSQKDEEFGFVTGLALFLDTSRNIAACVDIFAGNDSAEAIGKAVLKGYDSGDYRPKIYSHVERMFNPSKPRAVVSAPEGWEADADWQERSRLLLDDA
jgi:hypothetical protein